MEDIIDPIDDLIGKVLAGEATVEERTRLDGWLAAGGDNRKYFENIRTIFETASSRATIYQFNTDEAWNKVKDRLHKGGAKRRIFSFSEVPVWRIAAGVLILIGAGIFSFYWTRPEHSTLSLATQATTVHDTLPDGSTAFLNKKSELSFVYDPAIKTRKVRLKGEAFFEVKHEEEKPFIIETDEVMIKDLGTAFNVKAYPENNTVEVIVESGEVQLYTQHNSGINLHAGEKGIYDKTLKEFSRIVKRDTNSLAYKTRVFSFNNTDLSSMISMINDVYGSKIKLANTSISQCHLTVNFNNDSIETVVDVLSETLNLKVTRQDDEIILDGVGCK